MTRLRILFPATAALLFSGCASVVNETTHPMKVETRKATGELVQGAACTATNDYGPRSFRSGETFQVRRSSKDIDIVCADPHNPDATARAVSRANAGMFGNIIIGGGIGAIIDHNRGTAYTYPTWLQLVFGKNLVFDRSTEKDGSPAPAVEAITVASAPGAMAGTGTVAAVAPAPVAVATPVPAPAAAPALVQPPLPAPASAAYPATVPPAPAVVTAPAVLPPFQPGPAPIAIAANKPAGTVALRPADVANRVWRYPNANASRFGHVELTFGPGNTVQAQNQITSTQGTYTIADDRLCAAMDSPAWGTLCYYLVRDGSGQSLVFADTGRRVPLMVR